MLKHREKLYQAYHTMLSMSLTWAFVLVQNQYFNLKMPMVLVAVFSFIPVILVSVFSINRKNVISYIVIGGTITVIGVILYITKINLVKWIKEFIHWCNIYNGSKLLYQMRFAYFAIFLAAVVIAVLFYVTTKFWFTKISLAIIISVMLFVLSINKIDVSKVVVGISIFYILSVLIELFGIIYCKRVRRKEKKEGILYLVPICFIVALIAVALPSKSEPIRWTFVKNIYTSTREAIEQVQLDWNFYFGEGSEYFTLSGFSDEKGDLSSGTELHTGMKDVLGVKGLIGGTKVYLTGSVSNTYTGHSWEAGKDNYLESDKEYNLDYLELFYALSRRDEESLEKYAFMRRNHVDLTYINLKTKTVFFPLKTCRFTTDNDYQFLDQAPQISFSKRRGKGTEYAADYLDLNLGGKAFQTMLREANSFTYGKAPEVSEKKVRILERYSLTSGQIFNPKNMELNYQKLKEREQLIRTQYTQLPEELPDRVRELALQITANYDNDYDKLKAIETYLKKYTYSLKTDKVPKGQDFVDYFLFEGKKGYCTSYASAMAVMGRCIGVPTRYVEGYSAEMKEFKKDRYIVRNNCAHAWAEAYINGVGWIPFEATSTYYSNRYLKWVEELTKYDSNNGIKKNNHIPQNTNKHNNNDNIIKKKNNDDEIIRIMIICFTVISGIILTILLYYNILKLRYKREFKKADYSKKMYLQFLHILRLLSKMGFPLDQQETIQMLANRVKNNYLIDRVTFQDVATIYMSYRYAEMPVTKQQYKRVEQFYEGLYEQYKKEQKPYKIWIENFVFLAKRSR